MNVSIKYSKTFDTFLKNLNNEKRAQLITDTLKKYAKNPNELPKPKDCEHYPNREKVALPDASVVVFYDNFGSTWVMVGGNEFIQRVA